MVGYLFDASPFEKIERRAWNFEPKQWLGFCFDASPFDKIKRHAWHVEPNSFACNATALQKKSPPNSYRPECGLMNIQTQHTKHEYKVQQLNVCVCGQSLFVFNNCIFNTASIKKQKRHRKQYIRRFNKTKKTIKTTHTHALKSNIYLSSTLCVFCSIRFCMTLLVPCKWSQIVGRFVETCYTEGWPVMNI